MGYWIGGDYIKVCGAPVGIKEQNISNNIKIYPNPVISILNITDENNKLLSACIEITNNIWQKLLKLPFNNKIDVAIVPNGCYFINITTENKVFCVVGL